MPVLSLSVSAATAHNGIRLRGWLRQRKRIWAQDAAREQLRGPNDRLVRDGLHRSQIAGLFRRA